MEKVGFGSLKTLGSIPSRGTRYIVKLGQDLNNY